MMFTKNVLLGSLGFATVLMAGNWSGAIAQNAQRFPTDSEMPALLQEFEQRLIPDMQSTRQYGKGMRDSALERFTQEWAKFDRSASFFLGRWLKGVDDIHIYPSSTQGKVCLIWITPAGRIGGRPTVNAQFNLGLVSDRQLKVSNMFFDRRKTVLIRSGNYLATTRIDNNVPRLSPYSSISETLPPIESLPLANTAENRNVIQQFYNAGCTASLPSNNQAQVSTQKHPAEVVATDFYDWYLNNQYSHRDLIYQKRNSFTPNLYRYLERAIRISNLPVQLRSITLNYDLFSFAQVSSYSFKVDSINVKNEVAEVYLTLRTNLRPPGVPNPLKIVVAKNGNSWQIANIFYLKYPEKNYNLLSELVEFNEMPEFRNISWENNDTSRLSAPPSSTPVQSTNTIAKYPTNDDFNAFEDKLQGNPESLVKLRGNQAEQRRKFQNDWKERNPNAAKFLGAWYTGDRYFYVFPSTAKGGTCVVTQDANGKLNMQIGVVLNKELRYGGGKGLFWVDRENIIASRDSGSGSLYPIYATSGMPELSESMIGDMERQKCITTLPFEADAQYYKERGDRFAKVGKKDEAIVNYRKAVDLYRKQNQLAQVRNIEAQIVKLGGTNTNASQSSPVSVYRNVKEFGFAQLIVGDRKLITAYETLVRASQDKYSIPVSINNIEFLKKTITTLRPIDCQQLGFSCSEKEITFSDYLELKQKIAKQKEVLEDSMNVANQFNIYGQRINNDTRYGGRNTVNQIAASTKKIWDEAQAKARTQNNLSFSEKVNIIAIQTRDDTLDFGFSVVFKTSAKALATIIQIDEINNAIRSNRVADSSKLTTNAWNYLSSVQDSLTDLKQPLLEADGEKIRDTTLKLIQSTLEFITLEYPNLQDNPIIGKSGDILKVYLSAKDFIDQDRLLRQPQLLNNLDSFDKFYLYAAQISKGLEIAIAGASISLSSTKADSLLKKVDAANIILFDALEFSYKNDFRRRYARMLDAYNRNQFLIKGVQSYLDVISTEVGNYLINTRTDAVSRRQDGSVTVSTQGIIYPP